MTCSLEERYFVWLCSKLCTPNEAFTHWRLMEAFHKKEFVWVVPNDDNRITDGVRLRSEFLSDQSDMTEVFEPLGCSFLEMLIGLSLRLEYNSERAAELWFWELVDNLCLVEYSDKRTFDPSIVEDVLDQVIWRTYKWTGHGGLFPLRKPKGDQTHKEIWDQMMEYLQENERTNGLFPSRL